ncbi:hypothetical protein EXW32_28090 (plasmid) [Bacillus mycoides]|nr:hypothetical protein EXW32_28090 [Bacillus mycoides]
MLEIHSAIFYALIIETTLIHQQSYSGIMRKKTYRKQYILFAQHLQNYLLVYVISKKKIEETKKRPRILDRFFMIY